MLTSLAIAAAVLLIVALALGVAVASRHHKQGARGEVNLVGRVGTVERDLRPEGAVLVGGEQWPARSRSGVEILRAGGTRVRITGASGHWLEVEPVE